MLGGGAMSLRGDKESTKDIDLLFATEEEAAAFLAALKEASFLPQRELDSVYADLKAFAVARDPSLFWIDLFVERVGGSFFLSESVRNRAQVWGSFGMFTLLLCSREDIFLSKSVTERDRDLEDMLALYRKGLDVDAILGECDVQTENSDMIWHLHLEEKLREMEERYDLSVPWRSRLYDIGCGLLLERYVRELVAKGPVTVPQISEEYGADEKDVRDVLVKLEREGVVEVDRTGRPYRYVPSKDAGST